MAQDDYLLVDGYNVLNNWPGFAKLKDVDLAHARDSLAENIANYAAFRGYLPIIVFDAYAVRGEAVVENRPGIDVVFTREGETADSYIEKAAYGLVREKKNVFVVTGDHSEQLAVLGMGAYRLTAGELVADYRKVSQLIAERVADNRPLAGRREVAARLDVKVMSRLESLRRDKG